MQKFKWLYILVVVVFTMGFYEAPKPKIQWLTFQEMEALYATNPKPIVIDMYTNWCGWCKVMDKVTYKNAKVVKYINEHFYAIKMDAESDQTFHLNGKEYLYNKENRINNLAIYLSRGRLEFPNTIFLSSIDAAPAPLSGYMKPKDIEAPLKYFAQKKNMEMSFEDFDKTMKGEW